LDIQGFDLLRFDDQVARIYREWNQSVSRLLIFDNCDNEDLLMQWRPISGGCRVLATSLRAIWGRTAGVTMLPLGVVNLTDSISLLQKHRPDINFTDAEGITEELGDLPLALHLAGSYLEFYQSETVIGSPSELLSDLRGASLIHHPVLRGEDVTVSPTRHILDVAKTFTISYDRLKPNDPIDTN
jgi:hypothetical protein